jgi:hypothetical protein
VPGVRPLIGSATGLVRAAVRLTTRTLDGLRRQAPGARMIGEMTVRYGRKEAEHRLGLRRRDTPE